MAFINVVIKREYTTVQEFLKNEKFIIRPKIEKDEINFFIYFEDAYKNLVEMGTILLSMEFISNKENFVDKQIEEWIVEHADKVVPSDLFKNI